MTLRKIGTLTNAPKVNEMIQSHLLEHGNLHYDIFILDFMKVVVRIFSVIFRMEAFNNKNQNLSRLMISIAMCLIS